MFSVGAAGDLKTELETREFDLTCLNEELVRRGPADDALDMLDGLSDLLLGLVGDSIRLLS